VGRPINTELVFKNLALNILRIIDSFNLSKDLQEKAIEHCLDIVIIK